MQQAFDFTPNGVVVDKPGISLDLSNWNVDNCENFLNTFGDVKFSSINLRSWNTHNSKSTYWLFNGAIVEKLTIGPNFMMTDSALRSIDTTDGLYSGRWVNIDSPYNTYASSDDFMNSYDSSTPGTYVWEKKDAMIHTLWETSPVDFNPETGELTVHPGTVGVYDGKDCIDNTNLIRRDAIKSVKFLTGVLAPEDSTDLFDYFSKLESFDELI